MAALPGEVLVGRVRVVPVEDEVAPVHGPATQDHDGNWEEGGRGREGPEDALRSRPLDVVGLDELVHELLVVLARAHRTAHPRALCPLLNPCLD